MLAVNRCSGTMATATVKGASPGQTCAAPLVLATLLGRSPVCPPFSVQSFPHDHLMPSQSAMMASFQPLSFTDLDAQRQGRSVQRQCSHPTLTWAVQSCPLQACQSPKCSQENAYFSIYTDPIRLFAYFINLTVKMTAEQDYASGIFTELHLN